MGEQTGQFLPLEPFALLVRKTYSIALAYHLHYWTSRASLNSQLAGEQERKLEKEKALRDRMFALKINRNTEKPKCEPVFGKKKNYPILDKMVCPIAYLRHSPLMVVEWHN